MNGKLMGSAMMVLALLVAAGAGNPASAGFITYHVVVNTSSISGTNGSLEFQYNPAMTPTTTSTAVVSPFSTVGGTISPTTEVNGSVTGSLASQPLTLTANTPFNDILENFKFGTSLTFNVTLSSTALVADRFSLTPLEWRHRGGRCRECRPGLQHRSGRRQWRRPDDRLQRGDRLDDPQLGPGDGERRPRARLRHHARHRRCRPVGLRAAWPSRATRIIPAHARPRLQRGPRMSDPSTTAKEPSLTPVRFEHTLSFLEVLDRLGVCLLVSTYQAGKLLVIGAHEGALSCSFHGFEQVMGIAVGPSKIAVGTRRQIWFLRNTPELAPRVKPAGKHDACYLTRSSHVTRRGPRPRDGLGSATTSGSSTPCSLASAPSASSSASCRDGSRSSSPPWPARTDAT